MEDVKLALQQVFVFLNTHRYLAVIPILLLILLLRTLSARRKRRRQEEELSRRRRRDEALNEALRNPRFSHQDTGRTGPIEVKWDTEMASSVAEPHAPTLMMELLEHSGYASRKYVFRAGEVVGIGSGPDNRIVLPRNGVENRHCEIFSRAGHPGVRSFVHAKTVLVRGKSTALVAEEGVYLENGDRIRVGTSEIQFRLFRA